ncbi:MAG: XdhC family protein [Pseudomonadota bacterium]|nr:XdhC family protein [Pseudomonadota bacterium]MEC8287727.1 XdhC family protein [Pseudomonadota bacterium]MEC8426378.1 XdhC family protein [Pseudomonadota bacterium]
MQRKILEEIISRQGERESLAYVIDTENGDELIFSKGKKTNYPELDMEIIDCLKSDRSKLVQIDNKNFFIDVYNPPLKLLIIGAVHIAQHLINFANNLNFDCILIDPREGFANKERFADVKIYNSWPDEVLPELGIDERTAIVTLTHDPKIDDVALDYVLNKSCFYIGSLGSKKTHNARIERLSKKHSKEKLDTIHGPIGLDIGARSPAEIALSIISEMISELRL